MEFILKIIINAVVLLIAAKAMAKVEIRSFGSALLVAFLIGILNVTIGELLRFIFHIGTLGIPLLLGLGFIIRLIVTAIIIKIVDALMKGFRVDGFVTALILAIIMALAGTIIAWIF